VRPQLQYLFPYYLLDLPLLPDFGGVIVTANEGVFNSGVLKLRVNLI